MARNYAALPHDYLEEMELLNDAEFGRICRALLRYSKYGEVPALSGSERVLFPRVRMQEDRFQASYEELSDTRSKSGKKGAAARWQTMANDGNCHFANGKNGNTKTNTETETDSTPPIGGSTTRAKRFAPPTLAEVQSYVAERHSPVDPQEFIDFYASKGWMVGKTPMKDWKAACRNAEKWDRWANKGPGCGLCTEAPDPKADIERMRRYREKLKGWKSNDL